MIAFAPTQTRLSSTFGPDAGSRILAAAIHRLLLLALVALSLGSAAAVEFPKRSKYAGGMISLYAYMYHYYLPPTSSTPWRPAWSPDGRELVFSMSGSLWKIKIGETTAHELTANSTYDSAPAWSPASPTRARSSSACRRRWCWSRSSRSSPFTFWRASTG